MEILSTLAAQQGNGRNIANVYACIVGILVGLVVVWWSFGALKQIQGAGRKRYWRNIVLGMLISLVSLGILLGKQAVNSMLGHVVPGGKGPILGILAVVVVAYSFSAFLPLNPSKYKRGRRMFIAWACGIIAVVGIFVLIGRL